MPIRNEWEEMVHAKEALLELSQGQERLRLLAELRDMYARQERHADAVEFIHRMAELEKDPRARGKLHESAAVLLRDKVGAPDQAVDDFNAALDVYFENHERFSKDELKQYLLLFEAIDQLCSARKDWAALELNYRRMLRRIPGAGFERLQVALWHALGEIYRTRLLNLPAAIQSFETTVALDPARAEDRQTLLDLYLQAGPEYLDKAVAAQQQALAREPMKPAPYRALYRLYAAAGQRDRAFCAAAALVALQQAGPEEALRYEEHRPRGLPLFRARLSDELWARCVYHPDEDRLIGSVFSALQQPIGTGKGGDRRSFGLNPKDRRDLPADQTLFARVFLHAAQVLGVPLPEVYYQPEQPVPLRVANVVDRQQLVPAVLVGGALLSGRGDKDLGFALAVFLSKLRPEHYLRLIVDTQAELKVALLAALRLFIPGLGAPADLLPAVEQYQQGLRTALRPAALAHLQQVAQRFSLHRDAFDLAKWAQAVDLTAHRAGLIATSDLPAAVQGISQEPVPAGGLAPRDRAAELLRYAVSPAYFEVRQSLGIAVLG